MFAFSQIVAAGGNPMEVATQMEKEAAAKQKEEKKIGGLSEDQAMAAFAAFAAGDGTDPSAKDPKVVQAEKEAEEKRLAEEAEASRIQAEKKAAEEKAAQEAADKKAADELAAK